MSAEEYVFHKAEDGSFVRKLFSLEAMMAITSSEMDGALHLTISASVAMPHGSRREWVEKKAKEAWTTLRFQIPSLACVCFRLPDEQGSYALRYNIPGSREELDAWVSDTAFFSEEVKSLQQTHFDLKDGQWLGLEDKYCTSLHASALEKEDEWHFSISTLHATGDGRSIFKAMELYLDYICASVKADVDITKSLVWGDEISRLSPPAPFVLSILESGHPPIIDQVGGPAPEGSAPPAPAPAIWKYPMVSAGKARDISRLVKLTVEDSYKIYKGAKAHGHTVTQVISALLALAYSQAALSTSIKEGPRRFDEVSSAYEKAEFHNVVLFPADQRHKLPGGYDSVASPTSAPLFAVDGGSLLIPLKGIKKLLVVNKEEKQVSKADVADAFWDLLVPGSTEAIEKLDTRLENYLPHSLAYHGFVESGAFVPSEFFRGPYTIVSSLGDLDRLNILTSRFSADKDSIRLTDIMFGVRNRGTGLSCYTYQIRGELACAFSVALDSATAELFEETINAFESWVKILF